MKSAIIIKATLFSIAASVMMLSVSASVYAEETDEKQGTIVEIAANEEMVGAVDASVDQQGEELEQTESGQQGEEYTQPESDPLGDRKSTRLNSSHPTTSRMPSSA